MDVKVIVNRSQTRQTKTYKRRNESRHERNNKKGSIYYKDYNQTPGI